MHSSKGLEFPVVFIFGGFSGDPPSEHYRYHDEHGQRVIRLLGGVPEAFDEETEAERQRLLYVALTRAGGRLYLPYVNFLSGNKPLRWMKYKPCCQQELMPSLDPIIEEIHLQHDDPSPSSSRDAFPFSSSTVILSDTTQKESRSETGKF